MNLGFVQYWTKSPGYILNKSRKQHKSKFMLGQWTNCNRKFDFLLDPICGFNVLSKACIFICLHTCIKNIILFSGLKINLYNKHQCHCTLFLFTSCINKDFKIHCFLCLQFRIWTSKATTAENWFGIGPERRRGI